MNSLRLLLRRWLRPPREVLGESAGRWLRAQRRAPTAPQDSALEQRLARNAGALEDARSPRALAEQQRRLEASNARAERERRAKIELLRKVQNNS